MKHIDKLIALKSIWSKFSQGERDDILNVFYLAYGNSNGLGNNAFPLSKISDNIKDEVKNNCASVRWNDKSFKLVRDVATLLEWDKDRVDYIIKNAKGSSSSDSKQKKIVEAYDAGILTKSEMLNKLNEVIQEGNPVSKAVNRKKTAEELKNDPEFLDMINKSSNQISFKDFLDDDDTENKNINENDGEMTNAAKDALYKTIKNTMDGVSYDANGNQIKTNVNKVKFGDLDSKSVEECGDMKQQKIAEAYRLGIINAKESAQLFERVLIQEEMEGSSDSDDIESEGNTKALADYINSLDEETRSQLLSDINSDSNDNDNDDYSDDNTDDTDEDAVEEADVPNNSDMDGSDASAAEDASGSSIAEYATMNLDDIDV